MRRRLLLATLLGLAGGMAVIAWRRSGSSTVPEWLRYGDRTKGLIVLAVSVLLVVVGLLLIRESRRNKR